MKLKDLSSGKPTAKEILEFIREESKVFRIYPYYPPFIYNNDLPVEISNEIQSIIISKLDNEFKKITERKLNKYLKNILAAEIYITTKFIIQDELILALRCKEFISNEDFILGKYIKFKLDTGEITLFVNKIDSLISLQFSSLKFTLKLWNKSDDTNLEYFLDALRERNNDTINLQIKLSAYDNKNLKYFPKAYKYYQSLKYGDKPTITGLAGFIGIPRTTLNSKLSKEDKMAINLLFGNKKNDER